MLKEGPGAHHVVPTPQRGWDSRRARAERTYRHFRTQLDTVVCVRELGRNQKTGPRIEHRDGRMGQSDSHGNSPRNIKDEQEAAGP